MFQILPRGQPDQNPAGGDHRASEAGEVLCEDFQRDLSLHPQHLRGLRLLPVPLLPLLLSLRHVCPQPRFCRCFFLRFFSTHQRAITDFSNSLKPRFSTKENETRIKRYWDRKRAQSL